MPWNFSEELARFGPDAPTPAGVDPAAYCASVTRRHYENFTVVSWLIPRPLLPHFHAIYAYCRWADDLADETTPGGEALALLEWWRGQLLACYNGTAGPAHPVMIALQKTIHEFQIPPDPFLDLLSAFDQDQRQTRYDSFPDLLDYCRRSANPVGRLVLYLWRCHDGPRLGPSDAICTGLQLANFWQDVARDFAIGRVYLPQDDLTRFGVPIEELGGDGAGPAFRQLLQFQVERTEQFFNEGEVLLPLLPRRARRNIAPFLGGGRAILQAIAQQDYDVLQRRPVVNKRTKLRLLIQ
ncbi:MAG: squalene synthase HpnC, partial [Gemmataceae bacterium]